MKAIRVHLTFEFNESACSRAEIVERLDDAIMKEFGATSGIDVHTRWIANLEDSPLFGAAKRPRPARNKRR